jgi:hypothetical protein
MPSSNVTHKPASFPAPKFPVRPASSPMRPGTYPTAPTPTSDNQHDVSRPDRSISD